MQQKELVPKTFENGLELGNYYATKGSGFLVPKTFDRKTGESEI